MNRTVQPPHDASAQDQADTREFEEYARQQNPVLLQAALWATRRSAGSIIRSRLFVDYV